MHGTHGTAPRPGPLHGQLIKCPGAIIAGAHVLDDPIDELADVRVNGGGTPGPRTRTGMPAGVERLGDSTGSEQELAQNRRPGPGRRAVQSVDGPAMPETVRLPGSHPDLPRPGERPPGYGVVRHRVGATDHDGATNPARPYSCRLIFLIRFTAPSMLPELQSRGSPAVTASRSRSRRSAKPVRRAGRSPAEGGDVGADHLAGDGRVVGDEFAVAVGDAGAACGEASFQVGLVGVQSAGPGPAYSDGVLPAYGVRVREGGVEDPAQVSGDPQNEERMSAVAGSVAGLRCLEMSVRTRNGWRVRHRFDASTRGGLGARRDC